jgi:2-dehydro-3-deoxygluconokinase
MSDLEVVTVGELLAVIAPYDVHEPLESARLLEKSVGGAEANVALGLAQLGHRTGWGGVLGDDPFGREGLSRLRGEGVDVSHAVLHAGKPTGVYFKEITPLGSLRNYPYRSTSAASSASYQDLNVDYLLSGRVIHLTGITALLSCSGYSLVHDLASEANVRGVHVSVDINLRQTLLRGRDAGDLLAPLAALANTLFMSRSEANVRYGTRVAEDLQSNLRRDGVQTIVTHDADGASVITQDSIVNVAAQRVTVRDPTGAGDAFVAGYLSAWLHGLPAPKRLQRAHACAGMAVASRGDSPTRLRDVLASDDLGVDSR